MAKWKTWASRVTSRRTSTPSWAGLGTTGPGRQRPSLSRKPLARPPARPPGPFLISLRHSPTSTARAWKISLRPRHGTPGAAYPARRGTSSGGKRVWRKNALPKPSKTCSNRWAMLLTKPLPTPGSGICSIRSTSPRKRDSRRRRPPFPPFHPSPPPLTKSRPRHRKRNNRQRLLSHRWMLWARP